MHTITHFRLCIDALNIVALTEHTNFKGMPTVYSLYSLYKYIEHRTSVLREESNAIFGVRFSNFEDLRSPQKFKPNRGLILTLAVPEL